MQLLAGNIIVHAVAYNASRHCASRRHDDDRTAAVTAAGRAAARVIAAGGRCYRGVHRCAAGLGHPQGKHGFPAKAAVVGVGHLTDTLVYGEDAGAALYGTAVPLLHLFGLKVPRQAAQVKGAVGAVDGNVVYVSVCLEICVIYIRGKFQTCQVVPAAIKLSQCGVFAQVQFGELVVEAEQLLQLGISGHIQLGQTVRAASQPYQIAILAHIQLCELIVIAP